MPPARASEDEPSGGTAGGGSFLERLRARAAERRRVVVFPEATDPRVLAAAAEGQGGALFDPLLLGHPDAVAAGLVEAGVDPSSVRVLDPTEAALVARVEAALAEARRARGAPEAGLAELARDPLHQAAALVRLGEVDAAVAGCVRTTADVVRAALGGVGLAEGVGTLSSAFFMAFEGEHPSAPSVLTFTDAGVVPDPDPAQLAAIASSAATAHAAVVGEEPRVAFLSYSTRGSAGGAGVERVREALERFRAMRPDVVADGELQGDAALVPEVARRKAPDSPVAGRANVLVFPDLASANLAYKLVQHLGGAHALGPVLLGLRRPFNDLSRGATAADIAAVSCVAAVLASGADPGAAEG